MFLQVDEVEEDLDGNDIEEDIDLSGGSFGGTDENELSAGQIPRLRDGSGSDSFNSYGSTDFD